MAPPSASVSEFRNLYLPEDNFFTPQDFDKIGLSYYGPVTNITYDWPNKEESFYGRYVDRRLHGSSSEVDKWGQFPHMSAYGGFSGIRGISDSSDMATPELSSCSTISPASPTKTPASSTVTTASSAMNIGYGGSEETRSELSKRRDRHRWPCELCDRSYIRQGDLRRHKRKQHYIGSQTTKHVQQEPEARDNRMAKSLQSTLGKAPLRETSSLPHSKDKAHPSSKYEAKLTDYQGHGNSDEVDKARVKPELHRQGSRMSNQCVGSDIYSRAMSSDNYSAFPGNPDMSSKKRHNPDDDASQCSGDFSSEEGDDSDGECDNVTTWNCSQFYALPFFLPYIRGHEGDTSSPCSDSPDSGSTTSGTTSDTPTSSTSGRTGGNGLQGNGYTSPSSGIGASNNSNHPILGIKDGMGPNFASDPQPLPLICWYSAAGKACTSKHVKMSIEVRHLWNDHAWGKNRKLPNHRLSDACQRCKRLFITQQLLDEHVAPEGPCRALSSVELEELNKEPNRLGISLECKEAVDDLRKSIDKVTKGDHMPAFHDSETMALLKQRVDSNVLLYINGSNTSEKTARSQLWKWYLIFKRLRPDDEVPRNPFISAQRLAGSEERPRADAHRIFMQLLDQKRIEGCLPQFDDDQRNAIGRVFLDTLEMLGANQANERHRSVQTRRNSRKRQRLSPPEDHGPALGSTDITLAPTTPAPAPAPTPVEFPPSVRSTVNLQHPTFTLPEVQNQLLPQTPSSALQSFMPSADNLWLLQQQQQEADAHSMFSTGDFGYIDLSTDYGGLPGFETQDR